MPWNGSGVYSLPPAYSPEVNGTTIDAARYNGLTTDVATGISAALAKNGENVPTANLPMGSFKHTGAADASGNGQYIVFGQATAANVGGNFTVGGNLTITGTTTHTGIPTGPTAAVDTNTTQLATTAYVIGQGYLKATTAAATYAPLNGTGASGTWGINISGNASTATSATSATTAATATNVAANGQVGGIEIGYRRLVAASVTTGSVIAADSGKCVYASAGVTIPNSTFAQGDMVTIYNNTAAGVTITISVGTAWFAGASAGGSKTLGARQSCTVLFISSTECILTGALT